MYTPNSLPKLKAGSAYRVAPKKTGMLWAEGAIVRVSRVGAGSFDVEYIIRPKGFKHRQQRSGISFTSYYHKSLVEIPEEDLPLVILDKILSEA